MLEVEPSGPRSRAAPNILFLKALALNTRWSSLFIFS